MKVRFLLKLNLTQNITDTKRYVKSYLVEDKNKESKTSQMSITVSNIYFKMNFKFVRMEGFEFRRIK